MPSKSLDMELHLSPELDPCKIIFNLAKKFNFRRIVLDNIDRTEDSGVLKARIDNLAKGIDAEASLKEDSTTQGYPTMLCTYTGPAIGFLDGEIQITKVEFSAYILQGICKGHRIRMADRHGYTPKWWPFRDSVD